MRISDWSSDVCSSDLHAGFGEHRQDRRNILDLLVPRRDSRGVRLRRALDPPVIGLAQLRPDIGEAFVLRVIVAIEIGVDSAAVESRSHEHSIRRAWAVGRHRGVGISPGVDPGNGRGTWWGWGVRESETTVVA